MNDAQLISINEINQEFNQYLDYFKELLKTEKGSKVLIIEDDPFMQLIIKDAVLDYNPDIHCFLASSKEEALALLEKVPCDLAISDYFINGIHTGLDLCNDIQFLYPGIKCLIISKMKSYEYQELARYSLLTAPEFIEKPVSKKTIKNYLSSLFGGSQ